MAKTIVGVVTSNKTDKTIVVTTHARKTHPLYRKQYTVTRKFMAHDEKNECQPGDKVAIIETRPLSARKRYALDRIVEKPALREDSLAATLSDDKGVKRPVKATDEEDAKDGKDDKAEKAS